MTYTSAKAQNEAIEILRGYSGSNPYYLMLKRDVILKGDVKQLNAFNVEYIIENQNFTPKQIGKTFSVLNFGKKEYKNVIYFNTDNNTELLNLFKKERSTEKLILNMSLLSGETILKEDSLIVLDNIIDFNMLISSIPSNIVSNKCFTDSVKELINQLAFIYKIDDLNMQMLVRNSINEKGLIDKNELRINCRKYYQFENGGTLPTLIYTKQPDYLKKPSGDVSNRAKIIYTFENVAPYDYLKSKYSHGEPSARELKIIEDLMIDYKMPPGVVNVLISYVLKVNNQKFTKSYVDTVASQWSRLKIETVEEAMDIAQKEHNKIKKLINKNNTSKTTKDSQPLPTWFNERLDSKEMSAEEQKEIDDLFKEFN